jgi:hypothetical protein
MVVSSKRPDEYTVTLRDAMNLLFPTGRWTVDPLPGGFILVQLGPAPPSNRDMHQLIMLLYPSTTNPGPITVTVAVRDFSGVVLEDLIAFRVDHPDASHLVFEDMIELGWCRMHEPIEHEYDEWLNKWLVNTALGDLDAWHSITGYRRHPNVCRCRLLNHTMLSLDSPYALPSLHDDRIHTIVGAIDTTLFVIGGY